MAEMVEKKVEEPPSSCTSKVLEHFGFSYRVPPVNVARHSEKEITTENKHSTIGHLIHFLNTYMVVVAAQCVCYYTRD